MAGKGSLTHTLIQQSLRASHSLDTVLGAPVKAVEEAGWDKREASFKHLAVETWVMEANEKRVSGCSHAWRIPGTEEPGRRPSMGLHRARHD